MCQTIYKHCDCLLLLLFFCTTCFKKNACSTYSFFQLLSLVELMWFSLADIEVNKESNIELCMTFFFYSFSLLFAIDKLETTVIIITVD